MHAPSQKVDISRELVLITVSENGSPAELRQMLGMAAAYQW